MFIYINGDYMRSEEVRISPFDHGYLYGLGVFETIRVYEGHPFLIDDHIQRLNRALSELGIQKKMDSLFAQKVIKKLLQINNLLDAYVRVNVSAGESELGIRSTFYEEPTIIFFMKPIHIPAFQEKEGTFLTIKRNTPEGTFRLKSHHYMNNILAKREIGNDRSIEGIFLTKEGYVAEGIVSNIFWVKNNILYTPSIDTGILNGVTRNFVLKCAEKSGVFFEEGFYSQDELLEAEEVFVTNSLQEIVPLTRIENYSFSRKDHSVIKNLRGLYSEYKGYLKAADQLGG
ncbi:aminodeoxychorismate lyase [Bacillus carboniphilus]|uniref:Aminodeoxychorismate lyase n=1 Tax=Bacillus carboniphilus TaxID=86663 RepID=A0ABY9JT69_9BACI|nr:aminodeoxychorismate lyase [Bacillus carboniphilus]WLR41948.1 aminodeoxychorismate lyase [Bacillus carboniphilus]